MSRFVCSSFGPARTFPHRLVRSLASSESESFLFLSFTRQFGLSVTVLALPGRVRPDYVNSRWTPTVGIILNTYPLLITASCFSSTPGLPYR